MLVLVQVLVAVVGQLAEQQAVVVGTGIMAGLVLAIVVVVVFRLAGHSTWRSSPAGSVATSVA